MNQITWKEIDRLHSELIDVRDAIWEEGLIKNDRVVYQKNWKKMVEIEPFITELSYERADPKYHSEIPN